MKRKFKKEEIWDEDNMMFRYHVVKDEISGRSRWAVIHEVVFCVPGSPDPKYYRTTYREPATEMQEERPFEYQDEIECEEVQLISVTAIKWVPVG